MAAVFLVTLGCPKNTVASRRLEKSLINLGVRIVECPENARAIIVNTCGFIDAAKEESIDCLLELTRTKSQNPGRKVIAIGCLAQRYKEELAKAIPEVEVLSFDELVRLPELLDVDGELVLDGQRNAGGPAAYLEISDGCSQTCAFCAIPAIRGPYHSRPIGQLTGEAAGLAVGGCRELTLVGQDTGAYGRDLAPRTDLAGLIEELSGLRGIDWIRVMYLQPQHLTDRLLSVFADNKKVCAYLDMPIQHAAEPIIKTMRRWGRADRYLEIIDKARDMVPHIALRTSVILGFPGETKDDLMALARFLEAAGFDYVGIFEFSPQEGTAAADFKGQVSDKVKRERSEQLKALVDEISAARRDKYIGRTVDVLIESVGDKAVGRSQYQAPEIDGDILIESRLCRPGDLVQVRLTGHHDYDFIGERVEAMSSGARNA